MMSHPLEVIPRGRRARVFVPLLLATLALTAALGTIDQKLHTGASPQGIVSFELAGNVPTARYILDAWDAQAHAYAGLSLGLDYLYMVAYSTTIAFACVWAADTMRRRGWALAALGAPLAWGQWLAAAADGTENAALIVILFRGAAEPWPRLAWCAATLKFALVAAGLLYALAGVVARATLRSSRG